MTKTQKDRDQGVARRRKDAGEVELRHRVRPGILTILADLMEWGEHTERTECLQTLLLNVHALGRDQAAALLQPPRHEIQLSETVALQLYQEGAREAGRLDRQDQ
ncbi:hypothetical protein ACOQNP_12075 [Ectopseudomonas khazarica]|uniref:hypothetical protein n=1 Tax=Ectopseudomonas khazarica TaxID=2502979 RepID=UPI003B93358D